MISLNLLNLGYIKRTVHKITPFKILKEFVKNRALIYLRKFDLVYISSLIILPLISYPKSSFNNLLSSSVVTMIGSLAFPSPFTVDAKTKML